MRRGGPGRTRASPRGRDNPPLRRAAPRTSATRPRDASARRDGPRPCAPPRPPPQAPSPRSPATSPAQYRARPGGDDASAWNGARPSPEDETLAADENSLRLLPLPRGFKRLLARRVPGRPGYLAVADAQTDFVPKSARIVPNPAKSASPESL